MNKITGIFDKSHLPPQKSVSNKNGDLFKNELDKAIKVKTSSETEKTVGTNGSLGEIQAMPVNPVEDINLDFQEETEQLLDLLESYASDLANPDKTLKQIESKANALKKSAEELMEKAERMPQNEVMRKIATESAMAANVEYIKFNRGDYI